VALKRLVSRDAAKYALPYMAVPATMLWNSLIAHGVMKEAKLRSVVCVPKAAAPFFFFR
jgi:hypothetical protein